MTRHTVVRVLSILTLMALVAAACSSNDNGNDDGAAAFAALTAAGDDARPSLLFVQRASEGNVSEREDGTYEIELSGVEEQVTSFTDRPLRNASVLSNEELIALWDDGATFDQTPPNAALEIEREEPGRDIVVVQLLDATIEGGDVTYLLSPLEGQEAPATGDQGPISLFIDSAPDRLEARCDLTFPHCVEFLVPNWTDDTGWGDVAGYPTIRSADLDGDGNDELIGRGVAGLEAWTFDRTGCGGVPRCGAWTPLAFGGPLSDDVDGDGASSEALGSGDFDGDGAAEVYVLDASNEIHIWTADPIDNGEGFADWREITWANGPIRMAAEATAPNWRNIGAADFDGDGRDELAVPGTSTIEIWDLTCPGGDDADCRTQGSWSPQPTPGPSLTSIDVARYADLDADEQGRADIYGWAPGCTESCDVVYWLDGEWTAAPTVAFTVPELRPGTIGSLTAADFVASRPGLEMAVVERHPATIAEVRVHSVIGGEEDTGATECLNATARIGAADLLGTGEPAMTIGGVACGALDVAKWSADGATLVADDIHTDVGPHDADPTADIPAPILTASMTDGDVIVFWESSGIRTVRVDEPTGDGDLGVWRSAEPVLTFDEGSSQWSDHSSEEQARAYRQLNRRIGIQSATGVRAQYDTERPRDLSARRADVADERGSEPPSNVSKGTWDEMVEQVHTELDHAFWVATFFQSQISVLQTATMREQLALNAIESTINGNIKQTALSSVPFATIGDALTHTILDVVGHVTEKVAFAAAGPILAAVAEWGIDYAMEELSIDQDEELEGALDDLFEKMAEMYTEMDAALELAQYQTTGSIGRMHAYGRVVKAYPELTNSAATKAAGRSLFRQFDEMAWAAVAPIAMEVHMCPNGDTRTKEGDPTVGCPWHPVADLQPGVKVDLRGEDAGRVWSIAYGMVRGHINDLTESVRHMDAAFAHKLFGTGNFDEGSEVDCDINWAESCGFGYAPRDVYLDQVGWSRPLYCWSGGGSDKWTAPCWNGEA